MPDWDRRYMALADLVSTWSKDPDTQVGCVVIGNAGQVLSMGYNGFPRGVDDDIEERYKRPAKYLWTEHAERNAIYNAARSGLSLVGSTIYTPLFPCADCARAVIQSGISEIVTRPRPADSRWNDSWTVAGTMLAEAGVEVNTLYE